MGNEAHDHLVGTFSITDAFTPTGCDAQLLEDVSSCISHILVVVFKDLLQVFEAVLHEVGTSSEMNRK